MSIEECLTDLRQDADFMRHVTAWQEIPARSGAFKPFPPSLEPRLLQALQQRGVRALYSHQAEAVEAAQRGENPVIVTATASGKTLCYNLPVLDTLLRQSQARALYLFPTKALAQDQLAELDDLLHAASAEARPAQPLIGVATYDGDTPRGQRRAIRSRARILLTNPDMLHTGILPNHPQWAAWFAQLRFIVLDELHTYRGVFGSHVANVLRRVRRICQFYGSAPQFICTSATIGNPQELAEQLLAAPVRLIERDGAPQGARHVVLYNPPVVDQALGLRRSSVLEADRVAAAFLARGVQTIVFARSRLTTELLLTYLRRRVQRPLPTARQQPGAAWRQVEPDAVRGYRGGYLPAERRAIEAGLRNGQVRAVVATNALELGVDIGQLGAAVLTGFPGTIASAWQQMGRAGRRQGIAASILIASAGALDQYVINHPRYFFETSPERAYINPDNLVILLNHLQCAAFELPFATDETFGQVAYTQELLAYLAQQGRLHHSGEAWHWMSQDQPSLSVSLRAAGNDTVTIAVAANDAAAEPDAEAPVIGVLDRFSVPLLLHEGAIYLHEGSSYLVTRLDWAAGKAYVQPASLEYYTEASSTTTVLVRREEQQERLPTTLRCHGDITVTTKPTTYRKVRLYTQETLGVGAIDLPEQSMDTTGYWLSLPEETIESLRGQGLWWGEPILDYGPNWQEQRARVRARDGYRCTVCGLAESPERQHDVHHIIPFRTFSYGPAPLGNQAYLEANRLENLTTLCRTCHRRVETLVRVRSGLAGLAYALVNVAPLHLMCDPRDLGVTHDIKSQHNGLPTITLYDRIPGGIGFAARLFELHTALLYAARDLVMACGCQGGCPACVGPNQETVEGDLSTRQLTLALLEAVLAIGL